MVFRGARRWAQLQPVALHQLFRKTSLILCDLTAGLWQCWEWAFSQPSSPTRTRYFLQKEISLCGPYWGNGRVQNSPLSGEAKLITPVTGILGSAHRVLKGKNRLCLIQSLCKTGRVGNPVCQLLLWLCSIRVHRAGFIFTWQFLCCYDFTNLQSINHLSKQHTNKLKSRENFSKAGFFFHLSLLKRGLVRFLLCGMSPREKNS